MIDSSVIHKDFIAALLGEASITGLLYDATEVRETFYQSKEFHYPNIRLAILSNDPYPERDQCDHSRVNVAVRCYTEEESSGTCQELAAAVVAFLHRKDFTGTGWRGVIRLITQTNPSIVRTSLWRTELLFGANVYPTTAS